MNKYKIIGILGGMGPAATASFFNDLIKISQDKYNAEQDTDYAKVYLYNTALEGFNETGFEKPDLVKKQLIEDLKKIEVWGADFVVMPCNTVHFFIDDLRKSINIPIISIVESTISKIKEDGYTNVGVISSTSTRELKIYENKLKNENINYITATDEEQKVLDTIILSVMSGKQDKNEDTKMKNIINRMKNDGADTVVLGCTELPLALQNTDGVNIPVLNTIKILAEKAVDYSRIK